jgi:hypothetical protein
MVEAVFASAKSAASELAKKKESITATDDALLLKLACNGRGVGAGSDIDEDLSGWAEGGEKKITGKGNRDNNKQKAEEEESPEKLQHPSCTSPLVAIYLLDRFYGEIAHGLVDVEAALVEAVRGVLYPEDEAR